MLKMASLHPNRLVVFTASTDTSQNHNRQQDFIQMAVASWRMKWPFRLETRLRLGESRSSQPAPALWDSKIALWRFRRGASLGVEVLEQFMPVWTLRFLATGGASAALVSSDVTARERLATAAFPYDLRRHYTSNTSCNKTT